MNNPLPLNQVPGRVAFDIDGVFGNVMELFIRLAREQYRIESIRYEDITEYYLYDCLPIEPEIINRIIEKILDYPHALEMDPFDHSVEVLTHYAQKYPLIFITARQKAEPIRDWVTRTLPQVDPQNIEVITSGEHHLKLGILKDLDIPYYVDDHLDTCRLLSENGITPIVFDQPWNQGRHDYHRVANWQEIEKILFNSAEIG
ncbi:MAG: haloacid dehalogenase [Pseudomonadota bacterium]